MRIKKAFLLGAQQKGREVQLNTYLNCDFEDVTVIPNGTYGLMCKRQFLKKGRVSVASEWYVGEI